MIDFEQLISDPLKNPPSYNPIWSIDVEAITIPGKPRIYKTPDGEFPSVTSVLGYGEDMSWLDAWKARVGSAEADRISERSRTRGTRMHAALEASMRGENYFDVCGDDYESLEMARAVARNMYSRIDTVIGIESPVWSTRLKIAGRLDCAAIIKGTPTIVDFKNARRKKSRDDIHGYFVQCALYAASFLERTNVWCPQMIVVIALGDDHVGQCMVFEENVNDWLPHGIAKVKKYWNSQ